MIIYYKMGNKNQTAIFPMDLADDSQSSIINQILTSNAKIKENSIMLTKLTSYIKFQKQLTIIQAEVQGIQNVNLTQSILQIYNHPDFIKSSYSWYSELINFLKDLLKKKSMLLISEQQWVCVYGASQFVMLCCDEVIRKTVNQNKSFEVQKIQEKEGELQKQISVYENTQKIQSIQDRLSEKEKKDFKKIIRDFIYYSLKIKRKLLPNFGAPFTRIYGSIQGLLTLYAKLKYFTIQKQHLKKDITICAYALGLGIDYSHSYIINLAIMLLLKIYSTQSPQVITLLNLNSIPTHYFEDIPSFSCKNLHQTVVTYLLYILCAKSQDIELNQLFQLFTYLIENYKPLNKEIHYFLERIIQKQETNIELERLYYSIIDKYSRYYEPTSKLRRHIQQNRNHLMTKDDKKQKQTQLSLVKVEKSSLNKCCYEAVRKIYMENMSNRIGGQCEYRVSTDQKKINYEEEISKQINKEFNKLSEPKSMKKQEHNSSFDLQNQNYSQSERQCVTNFDQTEKCGSTNNMLQIFAEKTQSNFIE